MTKSKEEYEETILAQLIKSSEKLAVIEKDVQEIENEIQLAKSRTEEIKNLAKKVIDWLVAIAIGVFANFLLKLIFALLQN